MKEIDFKEKMIEAVKEVFSIHRVFDGHACPFYVDFYNFGIFG